MSSATSCSGGWRCRYCDPANNSADISSTSMLVKTVSALETKLNTLQDEIVDIVNNLENISKMCTNPKSPEAPPKEPAIKHPSEIPDFDGIEILEVVQVHNEVLDNSVTSMDMNVSDLQESATPQHHLNSQALTCQ